MEGGSPTTPNDYWDHVDYILLKAEEKGLYMGLLPCWGWNYVNGGGGRGDLHIYKEKNACSYGKFLGTAMLDATAAGNYSSASKVANTWIRFNKSIIPEKLGVDGYRERYEIYR